MKNNISTPLALVLNIMDIPSAKIARSIFVDQSLISKWKSGNRSLTHNSQYLRALVDFLTEEDKEDNKLGKFFDELHKTAQGGRDTRRRLFEFLSQKEVPARLAQRAVGTKKTVYSSQFSVYGEADYVFSLLTGKMLETQAQTLYIHECRSFSYVTGNEETRQSWLCDMNRLLDNGNRIVFIYEEVPDLTEFLKAAYSVRQHKNVTEYFIKRSNPSFARST